MTPEGRTRTRKTQDMDPLCSCLLPVTTIEVPGRNVDVPGTMVDVPAAIVDVRFLHYLQRTTQHVGVPALHFAVLFTANRFHVGRASAITNFILNKPEFRNFSAKMIT